MKRYIVFLHALFAYLLPAADLSACDVCGGGGGSGYGSIMPMFQQNTVGLRMQHSLFRHPDGMNRNGESIVISDQYREADIWLRSRLANRLFFTTLLPIRENLRRETLHESRIRGLGDLRAEIAWIALNTADSSGRLWKHLLQLGGGIKLNNGRYMQRLGNGVMAPLPLQTGSGALGGLLRAQYIVRRGSTGLQADMQWNTFGTNELKYRMGSQAIAGLRAFFWNYRGSWQYLFSGGLAAERIARDMEYGANKPESGGRFLHAQAEAVFFFGRFSLQCQVGVPILQLSTPAQPKAQPQVGLGAACFF
jgi:hypothetical protein